MGLYYREKFTNGQEIAVWEITEPEEELADRCKAAGHLPGFYRQTTSKQRRLERMAVRLLLDTLQGPRVILHYKENGQPFLHSSLSAVSIAHTRRFVCLLTAPGKQAGIDIECMTRIFEAVEKKALHPAEKPDLIRCARQSGAPDQIRCALWCAKEAVYKYMGQEGVDFASQIIVSPFIPGDEGVSQAVFIEKNGNQIRLPLSYKRLEDHLMVWIVPE
jgi:phosphopantetheinyl transferase